MFVVGLMIVLNYDSDCGPVASPAEGAQTMKAIRYSCYGPPEVLQYTDVEKPVIGDGDLLVRVRAAGANPLDWHFMRGEPNFMRLLSGIGKPKDQRLGVDFAGTVEAVGRDVTRFAPGDEVFGGVTGAYGEYVRISQERAVAAKPGNVSFEQAGAVAIAGVTALQGLRDKGQLQAGDKVLINGASGGVGTFAVQIAKAMGAEVTGVCSTRNLEMVRALGADHVVDYTQENFTESGAGYDLILDNVGNHSFSDLRRVMKPDGILVMVGGSGDGGTLGFLLGALSTRVQALFASQKLVGFIARLNQQDLQVLADMMASGQVTPVIDRVYPLTETAQAISYLEEGHARGKVVIAVP